MEKSSYGYESSLWMKDGQAKWVMCVARHEESMRQMETDRRRVERRAWLKEIRDIQDGAMARNAKKRDA